MYSCKAVAGDPAVQNPELISSFSFAKQSGWSLSIPQGHSNGHQMSVKRENGRPYRIRQMSCCRILKGVQVALLGSAAHLPWDETGSD